MASAGFHDHVTVLFQYNVRIVVEVEDGDGRKFDGRAARFGHPVRVHQVHERLHDGVIGRVHVSVQRERALAVAVECRIAVRCDDPVLQQANKANETNEFCAIWIT